jgi:ArsR family transcriptional regulator, arsenate/arsenite/antimonite-responsive transcriptional repressor
VSQTQRKPANPVAEPVDLFKVLSDPVRLDLYQRIIAVPEMSCTRLVDDADVTASTVSYHVKLLKTAGLVAVRKQGRNYFYTGRVGPLDDLQHLFAELAATCRHNSAAPAGATSRSS